MSVSTGTDLPARVAPLKLSYEHCGPGDCSGNVMRHEQLMSPVSPDCETDDGLNGKTKECSSIRGCVFVGAQVEDVDEYLGFLKETSSDCSRFPVLCLSEYGIDGDYASDIWVLLHNAVRREFLDLYEMINCMRQLKLLLTTEDIYDFRRWWRFFSILWDQFVLHNKVSLQPVVKQICQANGEDAWICKELRKLSEDNDWLLLKMEEVSSYIEEFEKFEPGKMLRLFMQTMDDFTSRLLTHFNEREKLLPPLVRKYFGKQIKTAVDRQLLARLRKSDYFGELLVSVLRGVDCSQDLGASINGAAQRNKWIEDNLNWVERMRMSYFVHRFNVNHGSIVNGFKLRLYNKKHSCC